MGVLFCRAEGGGIGDALLTTTFGVACDTSGVVDLEAALRAWGVNVCRCGVVLRSLLNLAIIEGGGGTGVTFAGGTTSCQHANPYLYFSTYQIS